MSIALPIVVGLAVLAIGPGCGTPDKIATDPNAGKAFTEVSLALRCPDAAFAAAITPAVKSWATRTGATVTLTAEPMIPGDGTDIGILPVTEFGAWADRGDLVPVPAALRSADHPFQWTGILPVYRERLIEWGGQARAVPLAGDGFVIVYRADRLAEANLVAAFQKRSGSRSTSLATWEEFADLAGAFAEVDGKPSLAPMSRAEIADLFFRVAACYDRLAALTDEAVQKQNAGAGILSFQHDIRTGDPRLQAPGFRAAADWLAGLAAQKCLPAPPPGTPIDPAAELGNGKAMLAVLSLAQLAKLPRENGKIPAKFGLAALPGTRSFTDPGMGQLVRAVAPNYIPYSSGGRLGVVLTRCKHSDAAFDLLAELGGPTRSQELVSTPGLGAGPFRASHVEPDRLQIWFGYGFETERSKALQSALRLNGRPEVKNAVQGLRGPDQKELNAAAAEELAKIATGAVPGDAGLKRLLAAWNEIDAKTALSTRLRWRKLAAGAE